MQASSIRFSIGLWFYAAALIAAATALFGVYGLPAAAFILLFWGQLLEGARREASPPGLIKTEPMALAMGAKATNVPVQTPEASAYGSQNSPFLSGQGLPPFETHSKRDASVPLHERHPRLGRGAARRGGTRMECLVGVLIGALTLGLLLPAASDEDPMRHAEISMRAVAKAVHAYHQQYGQLPPNQLLDSQGRPLHSWRALILPFLGEDKLATAYRWDEAWDGPNNALLHRYRPWHYQPYYPETSEEPQDCSLELLRGADDQFWIVEHEQRMEDWLKPTALSPAAWIDRSTAPPVVEKGFWQRGFFFSTYRGRLAVNAEQTWEVKPLPTERGAGGQDVHALRPDIERRLNMGSPHTVWHFDNALRLVFFLAVALYPLRCLRRLHRSLLTELEKPPGN